LARYGRELLEFYVVKTHKPGLCNLVQSIKQLRLRRKHFEQGETESMTSGLRIPFGGASGFAKVGGGKRSPTIDKRIGLERLPRQAYAPTDFSLLTHSQQPD
jgi:hypothetical protein